jgi:hypothetical protein
MLNDRIVLSSAVSVGTVTPALFLEISSLAFMTRRVHVLMAAAD